ncbi:hypothetical protein GCM10009830_41740 [Glycomyces endophyticus]|uniref:DUF3267 domain-containing protein n=1 Tax=Glycomyces endophyticus TaxID=480996 RepID=A0ABN2HL53_9ACTN
MSSAATAARSGRAVRSAALAVAAQVRPLLLLASLILGAALTWAAVSGDTTQLPVAAWIFAAVVAGLTGSFVLHECAHAAVLERLPAVTAVTVERTRARISVIPHGRMTGRQSAGAAAAGPLAATAAGVLLALPEATRPLSWWYLGHAVFLLPVFGDGLALLKGLLTGSGVIETRPAAPER